VQHEGGGLILKAETVLLGGLEDELYRIRRRIDKEENPVKKAKMISTYRKLSRVLTGKEP
jgi:hypothetical protein